MVFFPAKIGSQLAAETILACGTANPCKIVLVHNYTGDEPDAEITKTFTAGIAKDANASIVAQGDGLYTPSAALTVVADALVANPDLNVIVGADQDCEGAQSALTSAKNTTVEAGLLRRQCDRYRRGEERCVVRGRRAVAGD